MESPWPTVVAHGYGIVVTVYRKWLGSAGLEMVRECVRQFLGVRLNKISMFWFDEMAAVRDSTSCYGLRAGVVPVERSAGLGFTSDIRFHDQLLVDMVQLCGALRAEVPTCTSIVCILVPEINDTPRGNRPAR